MVLDHPRISNLILNGATGEPDVAFLEGLPNLEIVEAVDTDFGSIRGLSSLRRLSSLEFALTKPIGDLERLAELGDRL